MGQIKHVGFINIQANNLPVFVSDDPLPADVMLLITTQAHSDMVAKNPGAIHSQPVAVDAREPIKVATNHDPITLHRDFRFPPEAGKWMRTPDGDIVIGCPKCGMDCSLKAPPFALRHDGYLEPSFICEKCKLHCMLQFEDVRPDPNKCTTCGCPSHSNECANQKGKGGKLCGCLAGTSGWEPVHVENWPPSEGAN